VTAREPGKNKGDMMIRPPRRENGLLPSARRELSLLGGGDIGRPDCTHRSASATGLDIECYLDKRR